MIKSIVLSILAIASLTLSYFYEISQGASEPAPAVSEAAAFLLPPPYEPAPAVPEAPSPKDSLFYEQYSKKLGMRLDYSEDKELLKTVTKWIGTPYRYGSSSRRGTDCSGFVTSIYREVYGIDLSRSSHSMFGDVERIRKDSIQTGDLVFFRRGPQQPIYHVGIYLKGNKFIHAATNGGVMISSLKEPYYRNHYFAAGRVN
ncbi:C40 family peptidase [Pontibacter beigongshangensis]|uniref:C40 family peptidase n=1 Tax=Pontibacter beigongshangensis TaxID=2574733 RepID=UPI00165019BB|nr:C40 family peptidase [Pontibacter beigongshangensis]